MKYANLIECAYLPDIINIEDDINIRELNEAYKFASEGGYRSFCTHLNYIPFIESKNYTTRLVPVIDFPFGRNYSECKLFEAGVAYRSCQKASASELDIVLNPNLQHAELDIIKFTQAKINEKIGLKYIIEIEHRSRPDIARLLKHLTLENCRYVKTSTGKLPAIPFEEKLVNVEWLAKHTALDIKVSGNIKTIEMLEAYKNVLKNRGIYGISYSTLRDWND